MKPKHTFESVIDELAEGLTNGTIVLSETEKARPVVSEPKGSTVPSIAASADRDYVLIGSAKEVVQLVKKEALVEGQTVISKGDVFRGQLNAARPLLIFGDIQGNIFAFENQVTVGENGIVHGDIKASNVLIIGTVEGNVSVTGRVELRAGSKLKGNIVAARISIEDNAYFKGDFQLRPADASQEQDLLSILKHQRHGTV